MIGDSIHCLRCALDHLVYAIAIHESGQDPPLHADALQFSVADSAKHFANASKRSLACISDQVQAAIKSLQPYNRPHPVLPPLLSMLRDFDNMDKHKLFTLVVATIAQGNLGFSGSDIQADKTAFFTAWDDMKEGAEIAAVSFDRPTPNVLYDRVEFSAVLALPHKAGPNGRTRTDFAVILQFLIGEVRVVIDRVVAVVNV